MDRKKNLVIPGGENIYPVEIENVIRRHPKIHDVAVIGVPDERLGEARVRSFGRGGRALTEQEMGSLL